MAEHTPQDPGPGDPYAEIPLFRELQRVLLAGTGPVNWELARQVGIAVAVSERGDPEPTEEDRTGLEQTVRASELAVADLTGLEAPPEVTKVEAVRRGAWVEANVRGLRRFFEPGAERLARALAEAEKAEGGPVAGPEAMPGMEALLGRMAPLLMGAQVGTLLGYLGRRVLGQYELPIPREEQPSLLFVIPNIAGFEQEWSLAPDEFRAWVALHETTHAFQLGRPWVREHFLDLVRELAEGMEFDLSGLEERLAGLDISDPQRLSEALSDAGDVLDQVMTDEQRLLVRRLQAFMAGAEGHADHVMRTIGKRMLRSFAQIDEAMRRRHETRGREERMVERLLGVDLKVEQYRLGRAFCDMVVELTDEETLSRMWTSAELLPSMPELEEPRLWLARVA